MSTKGVQLKNGIKDGVPIGLGYLSVSFGFGIAAVMGGLPALSAVLISMTNLTSAGQVAGLSVILAAGTLLEMALSQFVINMRYALMSLSLSQKLDGNVGLIDRMIISFGITDEVFGVASSRPGLLSKSYMYGLVLIPYIGWSVGTLFGAFAGSVLPQSLKLALGIALYAMFIAIIIPPARKSRGVLLAVAISVVISCCIRYIPLFSFITDGFSVIICAVIASAIVARLFPVDYELEESR